MFAIRFLNILPEEKREQILSALASPSSQVAIIGDWQIDMVGMIVGAIGKELEAGTRVAILVSHNIEGCFWRQYLEERFPQIFTDGAYSGSVRLVETVIPNEADLFVREAKEIDKKDCDVPIPDPLEPAIVAGARVWYFRRLRSSRRTAHILRDCYSQHFPSLIKQEIIALFYTPFRTYSYPTKDVIVLPAQEWFDIWKTHKVQNEWNVEQLRVYTRDGYAEETQAEQVELKRYIAMEGQSIEVTESF